MPTLLSFVFRLILLAAGLVFAVSLAAALALMMAGWAVRAAWAKLTGRPVVPFAMHVHPRDGFERMYRRAEQASRTPRADAVRAGRRGGEVTDVEPK